jgi:pectin methylesterase-like acyl-CoA thioesterase
LFGGYIGSLQIGQTNGFHTIVIASGTTLNVTNSGGLFVGTSGDTGATKALTNTITGAGAALNLSNTNANLVLNQGENSLNNSRAILDLSGLDTLTANIRAIGLGSVHFTNAIAQRNSGTLLLAKTNNITLSLSNSLANYSTLGTQVNAIESAYVGAGNNSGSLSLLILGQTNAFFVDSLGIGRSKASTASAGSMFFNSAFANPSARFRGISGANSRVTWWALGDMADNASSAQQAVGTNDFSLGTVDALVDTMSLGRDCTSQHTAQGNNIGVFTFVAGTVDVNTLYVGNQILGPNTSFSGNLGIMNVNGASAKLVINNSITLGRTTVAWAPGVGGTNAARTSGILNIRNGGTVQANLIAVGNASSNNIMTLTNGTLVLSNTVAGPARWLTTLATSNSTLQLNITTSTNICVTNLVTGGATNIINPASVAVYASYPRQVTLIQYAGTIGGAGFNFGFGPYSLPSSAPGAYLSNNVANHSVDLYLPSDPRPGIITQPPFGYSGFPSNDVTLATTLTSGTAPDGLYYQWYFNVTTALANGPTGNGSTNVGVNTGTYTLQNCQTNDSGNYTLVVTNIYGVATSAVAVLSISTNDITPSIVSISPGTNQTVIQGNSATFSLSTSGSPAPDYYWYDNTSTLIPTATTATLVLNNVQYSQLGYYSVVVSNRAGTATTNMFLNVIVPPIITNEPANQVVNVGQSVSFSVLAGGVPNPWYQWKKNGVPISPAANNTATNATFTISSAAGSDIANYSCMLTNQAGQTNTTSASLVVNSVALTVTAESPTNGASSVCYDTPLAITFSQTPVLGTLGKISIYNATNPATPVDALDLSLGSPQLRTIAGHQFSTYPVFISGTTATIYPHLGVMTSNQTYFVTVDDGTFADTTGAYFPGISDTNAWRFSTKPGGPANPTNIVVAADGTGDFLTVQGAVDSVPANSTTPRIINVRNGYYNEIVNVNSKHNLDFRGQSRNGTLVAYPNNATLQAQDSGSAPWRASFIINANDCAFETITITNSTPHGGSQAEAVDVEGTRFILYNMELDSFQDTFLAHNSGKLIYFQDDLIQGDTDFNWGLGTVYYTNCELRCMSAGSHVTQPRTPQFTNGFGFFKCKVTKGSASATADLGRSISTPGTPSGVLFAQCLLDDIVTGYASDAGTNFCYALCSNLTATVEKTSLLNANHLAPTDPLVLLVENATNWLYGWAPQLAPNLLTNPASQSIAGGGTIQLAAFATGIPSPSYQWYQNGNLLPGQTGATLTIASANVTNAGSYSVVASNIVGTVTSTSVNVTVGNTAPSLAAIPNATNNVGVTVSVTPSASDPDSPPQTLSFSLLSGPSTTFDTGTGAYTWRPQVTDAGTVNTVQISVTDNGSPNLSATQSFVVAVNPLTQPDVSNAGFSGGLFTLTVGGQTGPDYEVMASTNLTDWIPLVTNTSPSMPFMYADPDSGSFPTRFYRIYVGPPSR